MLFDHSLFQFLTTKGIWMFFLLVGMFYLGGFILTLMGKTHNNKNEFNEEFVLIKKRLGYRVQKGLSPAEILIDFAVMSKDARTAKQLDDSFRFLVAQYEKLEAKERKSSYTN